MVRRRARTSPINWAGGYARRTALRDTIAPLSEWYFLDEKYVHEFHDALAHLERIGSLVDDFKMPPRR